jgi:hypothetical protein
LGQSPKTKKELAGAHRSRTHLRGYPLTEALKAWGRTGDHPFPGRF